MAVRGKVRERLVWERDALNISIIQETMTMTLIVNYKSFHENDR